MKAILAIVCVCAVTCIAAAEESGLKNNQKRDIKEHAEQLKAYHYRVQQQHHQQQQQHNSHHEGQHGPQNHYVYYQRSAAHSGNHQQFGEPQLEGHHLHLWEAQKARAQEYHGHAGHAHNQQRLQAWGPNQQEYIQHNHINYNQHHLAFEQLPQPQRLQQHRQPAFWGQQHNPALVKHVVAHKVVYPSEAPRYIPVAMTVPQVRVEKKVQPPSSVVVQKSIPVYMEQQIVYPVQQSAVHDPIHQQRPYKEVSVIRVPQPMAVHVDKPYPVYMPHLAYMAKSAPVQVIFQNADHK